MKNKLNIVLLLFSLIGFWTFSSTTVNAERLTEQSATEIAKQHDAKPIPVAKAKEAGAQAIVITSTEQMNALLNDEYIPLEDTIGASIKNLTNNTLSLFKPVNAVAASTTKVVKKRLWPAQYATSHIYGNVRFRKSGTKIQRVLNAWTVQTGVAWPIAWKQSTYWTTLNSNKKSGKATFKGTRIYYLIIPKKEIAYSKATTFQMTFQ